MRSRIYILLLLFLSSHCLLVEASIDQSKPQPPFEKTDRAKWMRSYLGRIDDVNDIGITLTCDGKKCKGELIYLRSKQTFKLSGNIDDGNVIILKEINESDEVSGFINAFIRGNQMVGEWSNYDNSIGSAIALKEVETIPAFPSFCGDNKWINIYSGVIVPYQVELLLQKDTDNTLRGTTYIQREDKNYQTEGILEFDQSFKLVLKDEYGQVKGSFSGSLIDGALTDVKYIPKGGKSKPTTFQLRESLSVGCDEFADYTSSYDITYPQTKKVNFDRWIEGLVDGWVEDCRDYMREVRKLNPRNTPDIRSIIRASSWSDVNYFDDQLISGIMTFTNTWSLKPECKAFNFDIAQGKEILERDLFRDVSDYQKFTERYIRQAIRHHKLYRTDAGFKKWMDSNPFEHFVIKKEGISYCTNFNTLYGQQQVTIAYKQLAPYFKRKHALTELVEH